MQNLAVISFEDLMYLEHEAIFDHDPDLKSRVAREATTRLEEGRISLTDWVGTFADPETPFCELVDYSL